MWAWVKPGDIGGDVKSAEAIISKTGNDSALSAKEVDEFINLGGKLSANQFVQTSTPRSSKLNSSAARSALVWAWVKPGEGQGVRVDLGTSPTSGRSHLSANQFAQLGVKGLKSDVTVATLAALVWAWVKPGDFQPTCRRLIGAVRRAVHYGKP